MYYMYYVDCSSMMQQYLVDMAEVENMKSRRDLAGQMV